MKGTMKTLAAVGLLWVGGLSVSFAGNSEGEADSVLYTLSSDSTYQEGCFDPCLCPLLVETEMSGTFTLTTVEDIPPLQVFEVTDIDWAVPLLGFDITGSGMYTIFSEFGVEDRLELDLQIDGGLVQHLDSGWVLDVNEFPDISITVSINGIYCYDIVLTVAAHPACDGDLNGDGTVGAEDLASLLGSWGPCPDCPADFNGDNVVNAADLAQVLGAWGMCR